MESLDVRFAGAIPANYDRYLGPLFLQHFARDLAGRLPLDRRSRILEIACGTGILTSTLQKMMPAGSHLTATDINPDMMEHAREKIGNDPSVKWEVADATSLPFADQSFDVVVCQFGFMFFADKAMGVREMMRVLTPGGTLAFNVWDSIDRNPMSKVVNETLLDSFPADPAAFLPVPFGCYQCDLIREQLQDAGANPIDITVLRFPSNPSSAQNCAKGLVEGTPLANILNQKGANIAEIRDAVAAALWKNFGNDPISVPMQALIFRATKAAQ